MRLFEKYRTLPGKILNNWVLLLTCILLIAGAIRFFTMGSYPLFDNTESRYAEIARKMVETNIWVMPQYHYGVPFWAKPPLSTWSSAVTMEIFGINEFAVRLSSFIFSLGIFWLVYALAMKKNGRGYALSSSVVLWTTPVFFIISGGVMTDPSLAFATTLAMAAFWNAASSTSRRRAWGYIFFAALGIGLLAKGPVAIVLTMFPIGVWVLWKKKWSEVRHGLPWFTGGLLMLAIAVPWYVAAEIYSPGFLKYFLIGEHVMRFIDSGWHGDLYGHEHSVFRGAVWLYWLAATFPWCIIFIKALVSDKSKASGIASDGWRSYLMLWALTPMIFFTLAGSILWTYVLPGIPAFALLLGEIINAHAGEKWMSRQVLSAGLLFPVLFLGVVIFAKPLQVVKCQKEVVEGYYQDRPSPDSKLVYLFNKPYSAEFYSNGKAIQASNLKTAKTFLQIGAPTFFVLQEGQMLPEYLKARLSFVREYGKFQLMEEKTSNQPS
ncbi:MAG: glycosyltransferase family 39 protein [Nitrospirota bacterium]